MLELVDQDQVEPVGAVDGRHSVVRLLALKDDPVLPDGVHLRTDLPGELAVRSLLGFGDCSLGRTVEFHRRGTWRRNGAVGGT